MPLLHAIIGSPIDETGRLFALVGRATFSAAMKFALDLEKHTHALFAGEPTGSKPNAYGDARKIVLPETGLTVRVSTLYWQSHPRDQRLWIEPHFPIEVTAGDVLSNIDPVVETVLALGPPEEPFFSAAPSRWGGEIRTGYGSYPLSISLVREGSKWAGTLSSAALALEERPLEDLVIDDDSIRFQIGLAQGVLRFRGRVLGDTVAGDAHLGSARLGFHFR